MATLGQCARELKKLFEQSMKDGANDGDQFIPPSRQAFITNLEQLVGIETAYTRGGKKHKRFNKTKVKIPVGDLDISAFGMEAIGHDWPTQFEQRFGAVVNSTRFEAVGTPQMASSLPITCAVNDAYGVLLDGRVYAESADEGYIGDDFVTVEEPIVDRNGAVVNGGFRAGRRTAVASNDTMGVDVGEGIIPPNMGQELETLLHINRARLNARHYSWTLDSVRFNRIADEVAKAVNATRVVKFEEERKVADIVLGVGTSLASSANGDIGEPGKAIPVQIGGLEFYPYQNGSWGTGGGTGSNAGQAAVSPLNGMYEQNYGNAIDTNGQGITQAVLAKLLAQRIANRDPFTNDAMPASLQGDTIWVANDAAEIQLLSMLYQWFIAQSSLTTASATAPGVATLYNFAKEQNLKVKKSQRWANRLTDVGVLTDEATIGTFLAQTLTFTPATDTFATAGSILSAMVIGQPKEVYGKHLLQPFAVEEFNVPGDMQMRGFAGLRKVSERSMTFFKDVPRKMSRAYA
jgi:hypothetical protein